MKQLLEKRNEVVNEEKLTEAFMDIMGTFKFEKVHALMVLNNWTWAGEGVPTVAMLESTATQLFSALIRELKQTPRTHTRVGSGGLCLRLYSWGGGKVNSSVEMELTFNFELCSRTMMGVLDAK